MKSGRITQPSSVSNPVSSPPEREKALRGNPGNPGSKEPGRGKKKALMMIGLLVLLMGGAVGAASFQGWVAVPDWLGEKKSPAGTFQEPGPMLKMDSLVINLRDENRSHYIKTKLVLELSGKETMEELQGKTSSLTDLVILTLGDKELEELRRAGSLEKLREELLAKAEHFLGPKKIKGIYFDEFLLQ